MHFGSSVVFLLVACVAKVAGSSVTQFGPSGCVSVARSSKGSCLLKTNCAGVDITEFDFAFDCFTHRKGGTRHSFGVGSFDDVEEYDTGVMCDRCAEISEPTSMRGRSVVVVKAPAAQAKVLTAAGGKVQKAKVQQSTVQKGIQKVVADQHAPQTPATIPNTPSGSFSSEKAHYGPSSCVSTWRSSKTGTCMMETACQKTSSSAEVDLTNYEFGLLCVDAKNELSRQLFGTDSFAHKEIFDTLIKCTHCLGLDDTSGDASAITPEVAQDLAEIRSSLATMGTQITALNARVFPTAAPLAAAAPSAAVASSPVAATVALVATVAPAFLEQDATAVGWEQNRRPDKASKKDQEQPADADDSAELN